VRFGLRTAASQVLYQLYTNLDYVVVARVFGPVANGIYALAYSIVLEPVKTIANVVIDVAFPTFARCRDDRPMLIAQFLKLTRLNLIAVLPFCVLILLIIPQFLHAFYAGRQWSDAELDVCAQAARILCIVGLLRALGFLGPPLLDGIGRPELTLRYMVAAAVLVPLSFVVGAEVLGDRFGLLSVAIAWAVGYPLAFVVLGYLVFKTLAMPVGIYLRAAWGIVGCCAGGAAAGYALTLATPSLGDIPRMAAVSGLAMFVTGVLLVVWQKITPRSIAAAMK
jgi:O-antigen/teichoic acid export membrane protein